MKKAEFEGLKGAGITILWIIEKLDKPFRKSDFWTYYTDKTVAKAFELLEDCEIIMQKDDAYIINPEYQKQVGVFPTPTTTVYINRLINIKDIKSSSRSEFFRPEVFDLLDMLGEPKRTELASLKHATPEFVRWRIEQWKSRQKSNNGIHEGLLVRLIEKFEKPPKEKEKCPSCGMTMVDGYCVYANCKVDA